MPLPSTHHFAAQLGCKLQAVNVANRRPSRATMALLLPALRCTRRPYLGRPRLAIQLQAV
jgi:hypothetical protein